jgi:hypothetical protein
LEFLQSNKHLESYKIIDNALTQLPSHKSRHEELLVFRDLFGWVNRSGCFLRENNQTKTYFNDLKTNYIETTKQLYLRELVPFCSCARAKITKNDSNKNRASTGSIDNLKGSLIRSIDKSHSSSSANSGDAFYIRIDASTKETLKLVFIKLLNQISNSVQSEQTFCAEIFVVDSANRTKSEDQSSLAKNESSHSLQTSTVSTKSTESTKLEL